MSLGRAVHRAFLLCLHRAQMKLQPRFSFLTPSATHLALPHSPAKASENRSTHGGKNKQGYPLLAPTSLKPWLQLMEKAEPQPPLPSVTFKKRELLQSNPVQTEACQHVGGCTPRICVLFPFLSGFQRDQTARRQAEAAGHTEKLTTSRIPE